MKMPEGANAPRKPSQPKRPAKRPKGAEGVDLGDQVYIRHPKRGAIAVKVSAVGEHGFTGREDDGSKHKVPWDGYLGHRARMLHRYELVEQGADGALVKDSAGRHRFMAGAELASPEEKAAEAAAAAKDDPIVGRLDELEKPLKKTLSVEDRPMLPEFPSDTRILLLKAQPCPCPPDGKKPAGKGAAPADKGATKGNDFGQKGGAPQTGAAAKDGKAPMKHGDTVGFRHGDVAGSGKITASGADGVTVQDGNGASHQVRHEHLTGPVPPQDAQSSQDGAQQDGQQEGQPNDQQAAGGGEPPAATATAADGTPVSPQMQKTVSGVGQAMRALMLFFQPKQNNAGAQEP